MFTEKSRRQVINGVDYDSLGTHVWTPGRLCATSDDQSFLGAILPLTGIASIA